MGYIRLERDRVKAKIHRDYTKALTKLEHLEAEIYAIEQNPKSTSTEIARGIYPVEYHEARYLWARDRNEINRSDRFLDEHIIGVDDEITNVSNGKRQLVTYVAIAKGQDAIKRAKTFDKHIEGFKVAQEDLIQKGQDKGLARRLDRKKKMREKLVG
jgi:hypothetical protein